ncbi:MAG: SAM-dependent methyltransferase [Lentisphaeria bacterium]|jgi:23S rRNA (cytidine2498-2'-O)-methyltransferase
MSRCLHLCKPSFEPVLGRELAWHGQTVVETGPGWVLAEEGSTAAPEAGELCFAHYSLLAPLELREATVNAQAAALAALAAERFREERIAAEWPLLFLTAAVEGVSGRTHGVEAEFRRRMERKMARVFRLAVAAAPMSPAPLRGLCVFFAGYDRFFAATRFRFWGQRRMKDDPEAPSRSYLKAEEAYGILGREPGPGETVVDLGAAPGGWSWSAAKRGARVVAVDNGPLKGGAARSPQIRHLREDAFRYEPPGGRPVDWLFCDLIENPYRVLGEILLPWLERGGCRRFVVNLKFGHHDPVQLLRKLWAPRGGVAARCRGFRVRQLHHDREEITLIGEV